ncbi:hypothetical protein H8S90_19985 [Olivibacter sp. SDN3]|uniref:hypothetical protein n=1 Tax=Olivibacter sp. SDN3 TaxID=2764720 RepID=UPI0016517F91|nr:hypothetical protein [Olivibacter sp. SDN3]QNL49007.1 hypothetical protein H8S90_19985 [Olivibacter sp. SDN3]
MKYIKQVAILNVVTYVIAFTISMLGQTDILGQYYMDEIAAKYASGITPANFTFSIWSLIYTALFIMVIYHLIHAFRKPENFITNKELSLIGFVFAVNQLSIGMWVYTWLNDMPGVSLSLLFVQLFTLYIIDRRLSMLNPRMGKISLFVTQLPLSIYFGWITIATLANFAAWLVSLGWLANPIVDLYTSYLLIVLAVVVGTIVTYFKHNIFFGLVVIWAIYGIIMQQLELDNKTFHSIIYVGVFGIIIILLAIIKTAVSYSAIEEKPHAPRTTRFGYNKFKNHEKS